MTTVFSPIMADFRAELDAIRSLVNEFRGPSAPGKVRVAAANSATLLLAAAFEQFIREMAEARARDVVASAASVREVPRRMTRAAWTSLSRTMHSLGHVDIETPEETGRLSDARRRFDALWEFLRDDLDQDIYTDMFHNENNMRPKEINRLFGITGLKNVCKKIAARTPVLEHFGESEESRCHGVLVHALQDFFERRNRISHSLNALNSATVDRIEADLEMFDVFSASLCMTLESKSSK